MIRRPPRSPLFPSPPLSRSRKHREDKPFAVMAADLAAAAELAEVDAAAAALLTSPARPIVLLPRRERAEPGAAVRSEEHTSELQSQSNLVCRLLLEKKKKPK